MALQLNKTRSDDFDYDNIAMDNSVLGDQTMASLERKPQLPTTYHENTQPAPYHNPQDTYSVVTGERPTDMAYIGDTDDVSTLANDTISERQIIIKLFPSISIKKKGGDRTPERGHRANKFAESSDPETPQTVDQGCANEDDLPKGDLQGDKPSFRSLKYFIAAGFAIFLIGSIAALTLGFLNLKDQEKEFAGKSSASFDEDQMGRDWDWTFKPTVAATLPPTVSASPSASPTTASPSSRPSTSVPSASPSTGEPSVVPSMFPTPTAPTTRPPTIMPSRSPSSIPSRSPSISPSGMPTKTASETPSLIPSDIPTVAQSMSPSGLPSMTPSSIPTGAPTTPAPTMSPSTSPPTMSPTTSAPTQSPSAAPSMTREEAFRTYVGGASQEVLVDIEQPGSPQKEVYDWLISDPDFYSYSEDRLIQRYALAVFSLKISDRRRRLALDYSNECDWFPPVDGSAACNDEGVRENIVMRDQDIDGTLPTELYMLEKLKTLIMPNSRLFGMLSNDIKGMKALRVLDLSNNLLIGSIPDKIGDVKKMRIIDLSNNSFSGALPNSLGKMKDAKQVILALNLIEGTIPVDIRKMKNLESLDLRSNRLTGTIPVEMMEMIKLQQIQLTDNRLTGVVEATFCQPLVDLAVFSTDCQVGGSITCNCCTACGNDASQASAPFNSAVGQSAMVEITEVAAPNLRGNQSPSFAESSVCKNKIEVTQTCFESEKDIRVHFTNCDAHDGDLIGLYNSNADNQNPGAPLLWLETCGSQDCGAPTGHGSVYFDERAVAGSLWPIAEGSYKALLVSKGPNGESYKAASGEILVQDSC